MKVNRVSGENRGQHPLKAGKGGGWLQLCACVCVLHGCHVYLHGIWCGDSFFELCLQSESPSRGYNHLNWIVSSSRVPSCAHERTCRKSFASQWIPPLCSCFHLKQISYFTKEERQRCTSTLHFSPVCLIWNVSTSQTEGMMLTGRPCRGPPGPAGCYMA